MKNREKETDVRSEKVRRLIERPLPLVLSMGTVIIIVLFVLLAIGVLYLASGAEDADGGAPFLLRIANRLRS